MLTSTRMAETYIVDTLIGMEREIVLQHAVFQAAGNVAFGVAGSLLIPPVMRKLRAYGVI